MRLCETVGMVTDNSTPAERRFVKRVKEMREAHGWTQGQLAERMVERGVKYASQSTVSRLEQGGRPIRLIEAQALAVIFRRTIWEMMSDEPRVEVLSFTQINLRALINARMEYRKIRDSLAAMLSNAAAMIHDLDQKFPEGEQGLDPEVVERVKGLRTGLDKQMSLALQDFDKAELMRRMEKDKGGNNPFRRLASDEGNERGEHPEAPER